MTQPDGQTVLTTYTNRATQVQDEGNGTSRVTKVYQSDGLGRLVSVCEVTAVTQLGGGTPAACNLDISGTGFLTTYGYDTLDNLNSVTQSGVNPRTYAYDSLSRLTSETNPESGITTYSYDSCSVGDLCTRVAPKPNQTGTATVTTTYGYDALHRLTGKTYSDGTNSANFTYDSSLVWGVTVTNPKGHLVLESSGAGLFGNIYSHDSMGRINTTWQAPPIIAGQGSYQLNYGYDLLGDITSLANGAEGVTYTNSYDSAARLTQFQSSLVDANHPGTLLTVNQYNALDEAQQATLGNGIVRNLGYDSRGRVTSQTDGSVYSFSLGYTPDSNILNGNDSISGNWTYTYDDFSRLLTSTKTGQNFNYRYDRFSNRWQQNAPLGGPAPQYSFDANNHFAAGNGVTYDAAGNVTNDSFHSYTYDPEGRVITVDGGTTASYVYDAQGRRVESKIGANTMDFIYDQAGRVITQMNPAWHWSELYAGGLHVATYVAGATYFDHMDRLGTVRARSSVSGASAETCTSLPFGDGQSCTGTDRATLHFTGKELDTESNLTHFWFRQLSTTQGRWIMPDPAGMAAVDPSNPQSWNRYAYVGNNPLALIDPLGLCGQGSISGNFPEDQNGNPTYGSDNVPCEIGMGWGYFYDWTGQTGFGGGSQTGGGGGGGGGGGSGSSPANNSCTGPNPPSPCAPANNGPTISAAPPTPWYKNSCITGALGDAALHVGIDAIGLIPEAGGIARVIGHQAGYVGVVADQLGARVIHGFGGSTSAVQGLAVLGDTSPEGLVSTGLTIAGFVPGLGQAAAVGSIGVDVYRTVKAIGQCH